MTHGSTTYGVGELHAELGLRVGDRTHAERHDVHGAALHRTAVLLGHLLLHRRRRGPVVRRAGALLVLGADEGTGLHAGDIRRVGAGEEAVRTLLLVELDDRASLDELTGQSVPLVAGTVHEDNALRLKKLHGLSDPREQFLVLGGWLADEPGDGHEVS